MPSDPGEMMLAKPCWYKGAGERMLAKACWYKGAGEGMLPKPCSLHACGSKYPGLLALAKIAWRP